MPTVLCARELAAIDNESREHLTRLRQFCSCPHEASLHVLVDATGRLRDLLATRFALEESCECEDPIPVASHLASQMQELHGEHQGLFADISSIFEQAKRNFYQGTLRFTAQRLGERLDGFYDRLVEHEVRDNRILLQLYDDDFGVGD